jgi:tetratricopeptide (TPR) repeat protein
LQRAVLLMEQGRYANAEDELRQVLAADPNDSVAHASFALCLSEREQFADAAREANMATQLSPEEPFAFYAQAVVFFRRNRFAEAEQAIRVAIDLEPYDADYFALLSNIHMVQSQWQPALDAAEQGLAIDPENIKCTNVQASALVKLNRKQDARRAIQGALAREPEDAWSHANLGWTLLDEGKYQQAMEHFREALRLEPNMEWARAGIIEALKAKRLLYRPILWYFLWISKFSRRAQWMIIVGAFFGEQLLRGMAQNNPALAPFVTPIIVAYVVFALSTWMVSPLFNLLLLLDPFGRLALSRSEKVTGTLVGLCVLGALASLTAAVLGVGEGCLPAALVFALLIPPVSRVADCEEGMPQASMIIVTTGLVLVGTLAVIFISRGNEDGTEDQRFMAGLGSLFFLAFIFGSVASQFLANALAGWRRKK